MASKSPVMKVYSERVVAVLEITKSAEVLFYYDFYKGKIWANVRKFSKSERYTGPTKSGIKFKPEILPSIIQAIQSIEGKKDTLQDEELLRIPKTNTRDLVVHVSVYKGTIGIDFREWQRDNNYTGWTKKGIRFNIDYAAEIINCLQKMVDMPVEFEKPRFSTDAGEKTKEVKLIDTEGIPERFKDLFTTEE